MPPPNHDYAAGVEPVPGYRLTDYLGGGTFGQVWKVIDLATGRHFALKIIDLSYSSSALKELRALRLVMNLNHPNLVPIVKAWLKDKHGQSLDLHTVDLVRMKGKLKLLLILMGLGEKSLSARLKEVNGPAADGGDADEEDAITRGLPPEELINYMQGAAKGIDYLNAARHVGVDPASDGPIVHCDIKPDNIMIVAGTEVQIADCGVAVSLNEDTRKTVSVAFSAVYAPPELTANKPSTGTDQYALAISYYELRTGRRPFPENMNPLEIMTAASLGDLDLGSPTLTPGERQVIKWATSPRIAERYPSCLDMVKQLARALEGLPPRPPGDLRKSAPVLLVAAPQAPTPAYPGPAPYGLGETQKHSVDPFTPPPNLGGAGGSDPYASVPAAKGHGSESDMAAVEGDVIGRKLGPAVLDSELQAIIRDSQAVAQPAARLQYAEPAPRPAAPEKFVETTDLSSTVIRLDTDPLPVEPKRGRRGAARSGSDGTIVPGGRPGLQPPEKSGSSKASDATPWNKPPAAPRKLQSLLIGVGVAVFVVVGGVVAFKMMPAGDSVVTSPTQPKPDPDTPPTTKVTDRNGGPQLPPPPPPPPPDPTESERFAEMLAKLKPPFAGNATLVELFASSADFPEWRAKLLAKLVGDGKDESRLADLADFAAASNKWSDFEAQRAALADAWYEVHLRALVDQAEAGVQATPYTAAGKLTALRTALALPTAAALDIVAPAKMGGVRKFVTLATAWENAMSALPEFAKELGVADEPTAGKFFAKEYVKFALAQGVNLDEFRGVRDKTKSWSGIDGNYQTALANHVQAALNAEPPKYAEVAKACGKDDANGWRALAAADGALPSVLTGAAPPPRLPEMAEPAGKQFARYLTNCAARDIDGLVDLYKDAKPTPLLGAKSRKLVAANLILKGTPLLKAHRDWLTDPVKHLFTNPYKGLLDLEVQAARLETATRLAGKLGNAEQMHRYLISVALKPPNKSLTVGLKFDERELSDDHLAPTLAYCKSLADDASRPEAERLAAAAQAARLAFRRVDSSFANCKTDVETTAREVALAGAIETLLADRLAALPEANQTPDAVSLRFSDFRAKILAKSATAPTRFLALEKFATDLAGSPDRAACLGLRAFYRFTDVYLDKVVDHKTAEVWDEIRSDAEASLRAYPEGYAAASVLCYVYSGEYKTDKISGVAAPAGRVMTRAADIDEAIRHFEATRKKRTSSKLDFMLANFLELRAIELRAAVPPDVQAADKLDARVEPIRTLAKEHLAK